MVKDPRCFRALLYSGQFSKGIDLTMIIET